MTSTAKRAIAAIWAAWAIRTLIFARAPADIDQWREDNGRYLGRLQASYPDLFDQVDRAAGERRSSIAPKVPA